MARHWIKSYDPGVPAEIDADAHRSVVALFERATVDFADKPAFTCFGRDASYAELERASRAVAAFLQKKMGVKRGDRIALMCPNILAFPIAMYGVLRAGAAQVNVNPLYTPRELAHQLNDAGVETILLFGGSTPALAECIAETEIKSVVTIDLGDGFGLPIPSPACDPRIEGALPFAEMLEEGAGLELEPVDLAGEDICFLQYTGGTTGLSKGAVLSHRNMVANTEQFRAYLPEASRPGREVVIGARMVLIPNPRDMNAFIDAIKDAKFSIMAGVNTLYASLAKHKAFGTVDFSNYRIAIAGGAAVLEATSLAWKAIAGRHIKEGYGLSETSPILCINPMSREDFTHACGLPAPSTDIKLLDDDDREVAIGERGEICAAGPQVMRGYWNKPEANEAAFTKDGYFRTGDIGVFDEAGYLRIVDRKKDMILVSGFNVYPNEVEAVVASCRGVAECACIGAPDEDRGEAARLYVAREPGVGLTEEAIIAHCHAHLAAYKAPREVRFMDALPKSNVGKILRRRLRDLAD